jgi:Lsr2
MAKTVFVKLTDDLDGSEADETIEFSLDGKSFEIDLNKKNAAALRKAFDEYVEKGRSIAGVSRSTKRARSTSSGGATLFSQLDAEEKDRFRVWAKMPTARRIGDARVQSWIDAGKP